MHIQPMPNVGLSAEIGHCHDSINLLFTKARTTDKLSSEHLLTIGCTSISTTSTTNLVCKVTVSVILTTGSEAHYGGIFLRLLNHPDTKKTSQ